MYGAAKCCMLPHFQPLNCRPTAAQVAAPSPPPPPLVAQRCQWRDRKISTRMTMYAYIHFYIVICMYVFKCACWWICAQNNCCVCCLPMRCDQWQSAASIVHSFCACLFVYLLMRSFNNSPTEICKQLCRSLLGSRRGCGQRAYGPFMPSLDRFWSLSLIVCLLNGLSVHADCLQCLRVVSVCMCVCVFVYLFVNSKLNHGALAFSVALIAFASWQRQSECLHARRHRLHSLLWGGIRCGYCNTSAWQL